MLQFEELRLRLEGLLPDIEDLAHAVGIKQMLAETEELDARAAADGFWDDMDAAQKVVQKTAILKAKIESYNRLVADYHDAMTLIELANEEEDASLVDECTESVERIAAEIDKQRLATLLTGEYDAKNAILTFHAGAGGTEAQDWASMLERMYLRYAERSGFSAKLTEETEGDVAGIKGCTIFIEGEWAYGTLRTETGIHRLVRKSPFDANARRHTSFASVYVYPEVDDSIEITINPADLRVDVFRASGAGGQHVQKTESAVRITHIPTGIVTVCQDDRSQHNNREQAMRQLKAKLYEAELRKRMAAQEKLEESKSDIGWGHQIRSYVLDQSRVKDLRTNVETGNTGAVLDGDLDQFIEASLKQGI